MTGDSQQSPGDFIDAIVHGFYEDVPLADIVSKFSYPAQIIGPELTLTASSPEEMEAILTDVRRNFHEAGVRGVRSELRSVVYPTDTMAVVSVRNTWIGVGDTSPGRHNATFILRRAGDSWLMHSVGIDDERSGGSVLHRIEDLIRGLMLV